MASPARGGHALEGSAGVHYVLHARAFEADDDRDPVAITGQFADHVGPSITNSAAEAMATVQIALYPEVRRLRFVEMLPEHPYDPHAVLRFIEITFARRERRGRMRLWGGHVNATTAHTVGKRPSVSSRLTASRATCSPPLSRASCRGGSPPLPGRLTLSWTGPRTRRTRWRRAEGKSDREIRRWLKRYIARQLYRILTSAMAPTTVTA